MYSLWQDLSYGIVVFDLVTLTLKFDLLLKKTTKTLFLQIFGHEAFIKQKFDDTVQLILLPYGGTISTILLKNFNLGHNFLARSDRAFILHMCISCETTFQGTCTIIFYLVTLTLKFDLLLKTLTLTITFLLEEKRLHIARVCSLWQDLSHGTVIFDLVTLTLKFDLL